MTTCKKQAPNPDTEGSHETPPAHSKPDQPQQHHSQWTTAFFDAAERAKVAERNGARRSDRSGEERSGGRRSERSGEERAEARGRKPGVAAQGWDGGRGERSGGAQLTRKIAKNLTSRSPRRSRPAIYFTNNFS